jgi:hypothetical protein
MGPDYTKPPYSFFAPPGVVRVSESALKLAREFAADIKRVRPDDNSVISFDWADSRFVRNRVDGPREDLGAGLDLAAYEPTDIPPGVTQIVDGIALVIKIPNVIYEKSPTRLIDTDEHRESKLILR